MIKDKYWEMFWDAVMIIVFVIFFSLASSRGQTQSLKQTEHGWRGKYLTAIRMKMADTGMLNIQITENNFRGLIDRKEVFNIISQNGGAIWSGDFNGLDIITFKGMDTKAKQDSVIKSILPKLERWYAKHRLVGGK